MLSAEEERDFDQFPLPVAVLGNMGDIVWTNARFRELFTEDTDGRGDNIAAYIYPKTLRQILSESGTAVTFGDREFTAYGLRSGSGSVVYFVDDTYYKQIHREYRERRTVVAWISFDNREEITRDADGSEDSRITSEVEAVLRDWGNQHDGWLPAPDDERALSAGHRRAACGGGQGEALRRARQCARDQGRKQHVGHGLHRHRARRRIGREKREARAPCA